MQVRRPYWVVEGFEIDALGRDCFAVVFATKPSAIPESTTGSKLTRCTIRNGKGGAGISIQEGAKDIVIENNCIHSFLTGVRESHGIVIQAPSRNISIHNNDIHTNSADAIQCQNDAPSSANEARDIDIANNRLHNNGENGVDIKTCKDVIIRGNTMSRFRKSVTSAGEAVVIHYSAQNVLIAENHISDAGRGISVGGQITGDDPSPKNVVVYGNTITDIISSGGSDGVGIRIENASDVYIVGNNISNTAHYGLMLGRGANKNASGKTLASENLTVTGNTIKGRLLVRMGNELLRPNLKMFGNQYSSGGKFMLDATVIPDFATWRTQAKVDQGSTRSP